MKLARMPWWRWIVFSVIFGFGAVALRQWLATGPDPASFLPDLASQQVRFERALFKKVQNYPLLQNIRVSTCRVDAKKGSRTVHVVSAKYCTGEPEDVDGEQRYVWHESLFVLPIPYKPRTDLAEAGVPDIARRLNSMPSPTVLDLLAAARSHGVTYSYAWWNDHPYLIFVPAAVLVIGFVIPFLLSLFAPPEPEPLPAPAPSTKPIVRPLRKEAPAPVATAPASSKDYRMKKDDYYPTEKGAAGAEAPPPSSRSTT